MKTVLLGATGMVGSRIATEALARGHQVTALTRSGLAPEEGNPNLTAVAADAADPARLAELAAGHDAVAAALVPPRDGTDPREPFTALYDDVLRGVRQAGVRRLVIVGGAGSLLVGPGRMLVDTPDFPEAHRGEALAHHDLLARLRGVDDLEWTYISPAAEIAPGERTGRYRLGGDRLLTDAEGRSAVSAEDYAIAFVDELESAAHIRERISVVG
ncbi:NAD(P)-dependent oxidoreductase [Streptomyces boncukensis]|uniref:NAD(P)H-binding protein n=1 Tax=Streptomyces boncukensis TaxID=2711219 RepID=A0A6G4X6U4_9ACTN|nr:NAD(P)H-binding protein [Streptomyces boncukensis]NGO72391.1 NAD(P)H-binding protein [Streptomyces boncukensis]